MIFLFLTRYSAAVELYTKGIILTSSTENDASPRGKRLTCSIGEAAVLLGIGRASAYEAANSGQIPTISIGRRKVVPLAALHRLLAMDA